MQITSEVPEVGVQKSCDVRNGAFSEHEHIVSSFSTASGTPPPEMATTIHLGTSLIYINGLE